ncbi:MAG: TonB-dependent copper receptor [Xanthomonadales bacterium]|nr:TonB-dependent copper receptor [Xanthomonadales bacterium]
MSIPHPTRLAASMALACASSSLAFSVAAAEPDAVQVRTLDTLVVTAVAPVSPLTWETDPRLPRQPVPASDGADYLKTVPGFTAIRNGGTNGDPVLRGMFGSRLALLTNDGAMPGACPARMDNPLSYVSPQTYDRLVVVKGPQTVQWGPGASAGTVRFERDTPHFEQPGLRLQGSLLAGSSGRNDQVVDATAGASTGYARVSANRSAADDYRDGNGDIVPSLWKKWNADVALGWTPDADTVIELAAGSGDGRARYAARSMDGSQFKRESYTMRFGKTGFDSALDSIQASVFHNLADHVMDNYTLREPNPMGTMPMPMASNVERRTQGGRAALEWAWAQWELVAGIDGQRSRHRGRKAAGRGTYRGLPWTTDAHFRTVGVFSEATWHPAPNARWVAGARVDRAEASDERVTVGMMARPNPTAGVTRRETLKGGFVRFEQELSAMPLTWYAGVGHTTRMPDYWELFSADAGPAGAANAFAGMAPEATTQLDTGLQFRGERVQAWLSAYAGRIDDYILFTYRQGGMKGATSSVANIDARTHGAEAGLEFAASDAWKLAGTLAWTRGRNRTAGTALPQMPPLEARLSANYEGERWSFGALLRALARQDRVAIGQGNVTGRDIGPSAGLATLALNGGYRLGDRWQLSFGVDNVFNRAYAEHLNLAGNADFGFPADPVRINEPGRNAWMKLDFSY